MSRAVEPVRRRGHPLEDELADRLALLDEERNVVGPDLERRGRAPVRVPGRVPEPGVEEAGVVRPQLAAGRVVRGHLRGNQGGTETASADISR